MEVKRKEREEEKARQREEKRKAQAAADMSMSDEGTPVKDEPTERQGMSHSDWSEGWWFFLLFFNLL